jgi:Ni/Co efflux regulator RcnB
MKKILLSIAAVSAIAAAVPAVASAQSYDRGHEPQLPAGRWRRPCRPPRRRIDMGVRNGGLTRNEAWRLKGDLRETARLESRYRRGGLNGWERAGPGSSLRPHQRPDPLRAPRPRLRRDYGRRY